MKLAEALSIRADLQNRIDQDTLKLRLTVMRDLLKHVVENDRYGRHEIKYVRTVDVGELRKVTDNYSKQLRNIDMKLQRLNWSIDLI